jgi:transcription-repair coupling factor (superfamily II helicase)
MHRPLLDAIRTDPAWTEVLGALPQRGATVRIGGLAGSSPALLLAALSDARPTRVWIVLAPSPADAETFVADLHTFTGVDAAVLFPQLETLPYETEQHHLELSGLRVEAVESLLAGRVRILVTTPRAIQEKAALPSALADLRLTFAAGRTLRPADLAARLEAMGFERSPLVEGVGDYALRGGILDFFGFGSPDPIRVEFAGDEIASIRAFDILSQRSTEIRETVDVLPVQLVADSLAGPAVHRSLLELVPPDAVLWDLVPDDAGAAFQRTWEQVVHLHDVEKRHGGEPAPPGDLFLRPAEATLALACLARVSIAHQPPFDLRAGTRAVEVIERDMERLSALLRAGAARGERTCILCDNEGQIERLEAILGAAGDAFPPGTTLALGSVQAGFVLEKAHPPLRILTDHEIFQRDRRLRRARRFRGAVALDNLAQLRPGDFVVHLDHGIGRFRAMERVEVGAEAIEALAIEYANGEVLRVPIYRLDLIERWVPDRDDTPVPKLHRIGGRTWKRLRQKTEAAIQEMAAGLLELYAARQLAERPPCAPDGRWQREMESAFLYEDTPDQRQTTRDVKRDMESRTPMDRLLCGDVGYGKTEIAVRAAFKAAVEGRQVAMLAPTTILVDQHMRTFRERLAGYPVRIEALSRFRSAREQQQVLAGLAGGEVDIVVGTHRLLEPDVAFRNLGLLIVDEEQRFGVRQKERFKEYKHHLDVLSLTATPIPRTLHLSLAGLRDLSMLRTPPRDRMPIITHVLPWSDEVLEDAMRRELDRDGQVFVVHNRVQSILAAAGRIRRLVPDAGIEVAHGQMPAAALERVMRRFLDREVRILVSTAIIENGLDVPSANTLIVDRADQFGLAQLYQLRGRVGRSHHRAYCYLVLPESITEEAEKRLRILEHFTDLGSGYAIALKDLELRGAGNILGAEQSGFVHAIGLDTYSRLLEKTVRRLRQGDAHEPLPCEVSMDGSALFPDDYVADSAQKLHLYRRLSRLDTPGQVDDLEREVRDRYGPPPADALRLFRAAALRLLGARLGIERILVRGETARVSFGAEAVPRLTGLRDVFADRQTEVEVTRAQPLSMVLRARGAWPVLDTLLLALSHLDSPAARAA